MVSRDVAVIGGGLTGMALARKLATDNHRVTVFEYQEQVGGLATWQDFGDFTWDRFYHVILPSDRHLLGMIRELGMEQQLRWERTYTGFYIDGAMHSISNNLEFLTFKPLSLFSKARLAWTLIYGSRINDWRRLEKLTSETWLIRTSGRKTYETFWKPLLLAKLGTNYSRTSAVFIWSYIKRLFSARDKAANAEHLGYVSGGYRAVFEALTQQIESKGGRIRKGTTVSQITTNADGIEVVCPEEKLTFDRVICTCPTSVLQRIVDPSLINADTKADQSVEYLGVVCVILVTTGPITSYYVVNIADSRVPFTGVIGMSSVVAREETAGYHLTYLPRYLLSTDPELDQSDDYFRESFLKGLSLMFPAFDHRHIKNVFVHRAKKVQPLQVLNYSQLVPKVSTTHPGIYVLNTSQFVNATLNNNEVIRSVNEFYAEHGATLGA